MINTGEKKIDHVLLVMPVQEKVRLQKAILFVLVRAREKPCIQRHPLQRRVQPDEGMQIFLGTGTRRRAKLLLTRCAGP